MKIIGLGRAKGEISYNGVKELQKAEIIVVKTSMTDSAKIIREVAPNAEIISFDGLFESADNFDELNSMIIAKLKELDNGKRVVYCVDGDGFSTSEASLLSDAEIVGGVSLKRSTNTSFTMMSATDALTLRPQLCTSLPLIVYEVFSHVTACELKLFLMDSYPYDSSVIFRHKDKQETIELTELDRQKNYDHTVSIELAPTDIVKKRYVFEDLIRIMRVLTSDGGCPWDKAQSHESIRINLIEEAYEAVDAIDRGDINDMTEELGDVLLQAIFHCDIAERRGEFNLNDVLSMLCDKLVTRHTHIFGENNAADADEALGFWEKAKAVEKNYSTLGEQLNRLPENFPSLLSAQKTIKKIAKSEGKADYDSVIQKLKIMESDLKADTVGEFLFEAVKLCTSVDADAEVELNKYVKALKDKYKQD